MTLLRRGRRVPCVTVIMATFNWSQALQYSIPSVLAQSFGDFELLVVGDACTDDSEAVVAEFSKADARVKWSNLEHNYGSQAGPNNHGLAKARGEYVAYLGHDDLWRNSHLDRLVDALRAGASFAYNTTILYGPSGSGIRSITGLDAPIPGTDAPPFAPPSSVGHRRDLVDAIGPWGAPLDLHDPVDYEFQKRAWRHSRSFIATRHVSVFKFTASWRQDIYQSKDVADQAAMSHLLANDPLAVEGELLAVVEAYASGSSLDVSQPPEAAPGDHFRASRSYKGVTKSIASARTTRLRKAMDDVQAGLEWYGPEQHPDLGCYRWTGPARRSTMLLPLSDDQELQIEVQLLAASTPEVLDSLHFEVNGTPVWFDRRSGPVPGTTRFVGRVSPDILATREVAELAFLVGATVVPRSIDETSVDERPLGVAVNWVDVSPAPERALHELASHELQPDPV